MLRDRLSALRRQAGAADADVRAAETPGHCASLSGDDGAGHPARAAAGDEGGSLASRLDRLARARASTRAHGIDELVRLTGAVAADAGLLVVEHRHPLPFRHGRIAVGGRLDGTVSVPLRKGASARFPVERLLFLDTETSGLAGGAGTFVFLLGLARVEAGVLVTRQFLATRFAAEAGLLESLAHAVAGAGCLVTFNGKSFDVPLLRTRYALARRTDPFAGKAHCDLLHATRRLLREGWPDCRLRTTEIHALGFDRIDDLPGAEVPAAWQRWLTHADAAAVPRILEHNRDDLVSLVAVTSLLNACEGATPLFATLEH